MNKNAINKPSEEPPQETASIFIENTDSDFQINEEKISNFVSSVLGFYNLDHYEINISFVTANKIQELNHEYRLKDKPTDVLSFPQTEFHSPVERDSAPKHSEIHNILGDLVVSLEVAGKNAESIGHSLSRETAFLLIHGILHLGGHDHKAPAEEKVMIDEQKFILATLDETPDTSSILEELVSIGGAN